MIERHNQSSPRLLLGTILAVGLLFNGVVNAMVIDSVVPTRSIDYHFFSFGGGALSIAVDGLTLGDPEINLFADDGSPIGALTGSLLANADDIISYSPWFYSPNSLLNVNLGPGNFVLAVGAYANQEQESRSGVASTPGYDSSYRATYSSEISSLIVRNSRDDMGFSSTGSSEIPEPATLALLGLGMVGLGFRHRRQHG